MLAELSSQFQTYHNIYDCAHAFMACRRMVFKKSIDPISMQEVDVMSIQCLW